MTKRDQQRLYNAATRLVRSIRHGGWQDNDTGKRYSMYSPAEHEIAIDRRATEMERVLKSLKKP